MDHYYALRKPLPDDFAYLCRVAKCHSKHEKTALRSIRDQFFDIINLELRHTRIDEEILKYQQTSDTNRKAIVQRWNTNRNTKPEARSQKPEESNSSSVQQKLAATHKINGVDQTPILAKLPLRGGGEFEIHQSFVAELEPVYPDVDVMRTLGEMRGWCLGNPDRAKTRKGIKRFITSWLQNEQDKGDA